MRVERLRNGRMTAFTFASWVSYAVSHNTVVIGGTGMVGICEVVVSRISSLVLM